jgi:hypothetical protein
MENQEDLKLSNSILALKWGVIGGITSFVLTLVTKYSGLEEDFSETLGWVSFLATLVINTSCTRDIREV